MRLSRTLLAFGSSAVLGLAGCFTVLPEDHHGGPPPHAPAHGYRQRFGDVSHVYEAPLGVFLVLGYPHTYFLDGWYYRHINGYWERCPRLDGRWARAESRHVPGRLVARYAGSPPAKVAPGKDRSKKPAHAGGR